ncbi:hypothetical protein SAMN05192539_103567 [Paraburkholderia diazotrophica]|uniref:Uncharacterized protein n=1 Tax=Paraburkholderia diazotrophica TaxID=667676 RepID=A0A1H7DV77_9BURK|nr:hypothetical protein SAMN05192539_103567 [Paraburkholderia diazotrophica]
MTPLKLIASTVLCSTCLCATWSATAEEIVSVMNSTAVALPGGLSVTPNLRIYGKKPPMPKPGYTVTPPERPPVVSMVSPGMRDQDKDDLERGHGQRTGQNMRKFLGADGAFARQ